MPFLSYTVLMGERPEDIFGFDKDMAARFLKLYRPGMSLPELTGALHTKRLTDAAWRRALLHLVLHIKKEDYLCGGRRRCAGALRPSPGVCQKGGAPP